MNIDRIISVRNNRIIFRSMDRVLKVFRGSAKTEVLGEAFKQACMEEAGLHVPAVLGVSETDGKWTIFSEYIKGKTIAAMMEEDPDQTDACLAVLVDVQLNVHTQSCPALPKLRERMEQGISDAPAEERDVLRKCLADMPEDTKICHGNFEPSNIILTDEGTPYILDWKRASQGDPDVDAAETYLLLQFVYGADTAGKYLDLFCQKKGIEEETVRKWVPLAAAAQLDDANERKREFLMPLIKGNVEGDK